MVLLSLLGSGEADHKVEFVEEQAFGSLSFIFFDFPNLLLPAWKPAAAKATGCVSFEILVFSRQKRTLARYSFFFAPHITFSFPQKMFSSIFVTPSFTGFFIFLHTCDRSGIHGTDQIYLSVILIFCFFTPCRCNWGSLWAWAYNKESKSIHYPGWESNGPLFYHWYQVWYSLNFFL